MNGILGLIHLIAAVLAVIDCVKSDKDSKGKILWILITLLIPLIGPILYFVIGKKKA